MAISNPTLYQINTRVWVKRFGENATLADVPVDYWKQLAALGVDYVWLMGVWQTGPNVLDYALEPGLREAYTKVLPDWGKDDVIGSPYAINTYSLNSQLGKPSVLAQTRKRINAAGMRLILDFVPNHFHAESQWIADRPDVFLSTGEAQLQADTHTFYRSTLAEGQILAHGKDPYFAAWQDTVQVNYAAPAAQAFMQQQLLTIAAQCDGVRCDMAMLTLPDVFRRTWGQVVDDNTPIENFWPASIAAVKASFPDFQFMAEVYWDLEWELQQQGFDYTYDKRLLDRLHHQKVSAIRDHLKATHDFQRRSIRFLENHDEDRALANMSPAQLQAAAIITYTVPGLRFFYEGQWEGRRMRLPVQLGRMPTERNHLDHYGRNLKQVDIAALPGFEAISQREPAFYDWLLTFLRDSVLQTGDWQLLDTPSPSLLAWRWTTEGRALYIFVNYSTTALRLNLRGVLERVVARDTWGNEIDLTNVDFGVFGWMILEVD